MSHMKEWKVLANFGIHTAIYAKKSILLRKHDEQHEYPKVQHSIDNWDMLNISSELLNIVGCIMSDTKKQKDWYIGLNS